MLSWIFGKAQENIVHVSTHDRASGYLELEKARIRWFLSINANTLPKKAVEEGKKTFRSLQMGGEEWEFSTGFENLHTRSYEEIIKGNGFGIMEALPSIEMVHQIRTTEPKGLVGEYHPYASLEVSDHPFGKGK